MKRMTIKKAIRSFIVHDVLGKRHVSIKKLIISYVYSKGLAVLATF